MDTHSHSKPIRCPACNSPILGTPREILVIGLHCRTCGYELRTYPALTNLTPNNPKVYPKPPYLDPLPGLARLATPA